jgi:uncharacterized membrane protein
VDIDTGNIVTLRGTNLTIHGSSITFTTNQLVTDHGYYTTVTAVNAAGTSSVTAILAITGRENSIIIVTLIICGYYTTVRESPSDVTDSNATVTGSPFIISFVVVNSSLNATTRTLTKATTTGM